MRKLVTIGIAAGLLALASPLTARPPRPELAGIRLGMSEAAVHEKLASGGALVPESRFEREREEHETWKMARGPYGFVALGFAGDRVSWVTAFARAQGPVIRFRDVGTLAECERPGNWQCIWKVEGASGRDPYWVVARGRDSLRVASISLLRPRSAAAPDSAARDSD